MSLAGKMLHCVHMRSWSEIAKRRAGIKDMVSWLMKVRKIHLNMVSQAKEINLKA